MATWTRRQQEIMDLVLDGTGTGSWLDIDSLMTLLGSSASKQATQCSLRILEVRGMLSRNYETGDGRGWCCPRLLQPSRHSEGH